MMNDPSAAALRELAQGLPSTPTLADAAHWVGVVAEDREGYLYLSAAGSLWQSVGGMDWDTADLAKRDSSVKRLPVTVDQIAAVRAALEGAAAGLERDRAERDRLAAVLHAHQLHPDWRYCMTFDGNTAHKPMDGWQPNPHAVSTLVTPLRAELYWMRPAPEGSA